ncbi:hypothetical protein LRP67_08085 [Nocardioides sp. cx-169]|uniref:hypothetical protein n=1 Tax=Nocardioides sp. cx-169 TaxID=2899080 RepID=UPI001E2B9176|nr:hypothetical protein [Nocardioides sp. cx-169]MCD4534034.1 hypothetical protein [Nocardioides sp. cx-169]
MSTATRHTGLGAAALTLALCLAGCGGDDGDASDGGRSASESASESANESASGTATAGGPAVLSQAEADQAALTAADVGEGYVAEKDDDTDDVDDDLGCLNAVQVLSDFDAQTEAEITIEPENEAEGSYRSVLSVVSSYADTATVRDAFATFRRDIDACDAVDVTDDDGVTITLEVTHPTAAPIGEVDEQVSFIATGTVSSAGQSLPYRLAFAASRVENNLSVVGLIDVGQVDADILPRLTETAVERLNAVVG